MIPPQEKYLHRARFFCVSLGLGAVCLGLMAQSSPRENKSPSSFKNLQVLKDVAPDQIIPAMQFVSASLGVECEFCHVRNAFEKDDKEAKRTARQMMKMMLAINAQSLQTPRAVTCYTCHRGSVRPVSVPMMESTSPYIGEAKDAGNGSERQNDNLPTAEEVLEKYTHALGSTSAVEGVTTRLESGTATFGQGPAFPVDILTKAPDKQIMTIHLPAGDNITAFDGQKGWFSAPGGPIREIHKADLEGARLDADLHLAADLKKLFTSFKVVRNERLNDRDTVLLFASNSSGPSLELYFDTGSGLLIREVRFGLSPLGLNPTQIDFDDYKNFDGVMVAQHRVISRPNRIVNIQLLRVTQNAPVDDAKFARP